MKWLLPLTMILYLALAAAWLARDRAARHHAFEAGSSLRYAADGCSQARAYLAENHAVESLTMPLNDTNVAADGTVFRIDPQMPPFRPREAKEGDKEGKKEENKTGDDEYLSPPPLLTAAEETWVRQGGRLVIAFTGEYGELTTTADVRTQISKTYPAMPAVTHIKPETNSTLRGRVLPLFEALFSADENPLIARRSVEAGEIWLLACPEIFENRLLAEADHLSLLDELAGAGRPVWFDERSHGMAHSVPLTELLIGFGLGPACALLALAALVQAWRLRASVGPPIEDWRDDRAEAVDGLAALSALYERVLTDQAAIDLYRRMLVREICLRRHVPLDVAETQVTQLGLAHKGDAALNLNRLNAAFRRLRDRQRR
jgi:hypothetical protein